MGFFKTYKKTYKKVSKVVDKIAEKNEERSKEKKNKNHSSVNLQDPILKQWAKILGENAEEGQINSNTLIEISVMQIKSDVKVIQDCGRICSETINAETFFMRLDLMRERILSLISLQPYLEYIPEKLSVSPNVLWNSYQIDRPKIISEFLKRCSEATETKSDNMKTEKGKRNQIKKYIESISPYHLEFTVNDVKSYILPLYQKYDDIEYELDPNGKDLLNELERYSV